MYSNIYKWCFTCLVSRRFAELSICKIMVSQCDFSNPFGNPTVIPNHALIFWPIFIPILLLLICWVIWSYMVYWKFWQCRDCHINSLFCADNEDWYIGRNDVHKLDRKHLEKKESTNLRGRGRQQRPGFSDSFSNIGNKLISILLSFLFNSISTKKRLNYRPN